MSKKSNGFLDIDSPPSPPAKTSTSSPSLGVSLPATKHIRNDGWTSALKGTGTSRDSRTSATFLGDKQLDKVLLNDLYCNDGLVRKIIDLVPDEAFRVPGTIQNDPTEEYDEGLISFEMQRLGVLGAFKYAKKMARLTGGAVVYIGAMGAGTTDQPLDSAQIDTIEFLKVFDLGDIETWDCEFDTDLTSPNFGKILMYSIKVRVGNQFFTQKIHYTRCIPFFGAKVPPSSPLGMTLENRYWGISIMQFMYPNIKDYSLAFANTSAILGEFVVSKYKFSDLDEILSSGNEKKLHSRISAIEMSKSIINAVLLGTDEDYQRDSASVAGLADLLDRFMMQVASVTGYPVTKLFGRSASGLNATGEGDLKAYYDMLRAELVDLQPEMQRFVDLIADWKGLADGDYTFEWGNLYQPTQEEEANRERIEAETLRTNMAGAQLAMADGVLGPEQVYDLYYKKQFNNKPWVEPEPLDIDNIPEDTNEADVDGNAEEGAKIPNNPSKGTDV